MLINYRDIKHREKIEGLMKETVDETCVPEAQILSHTKKAEVVHARDVYIRKLHGAGLLIRTIARVMNRDHSTIIHSLKKTEKKLC